MSKKIMNKILDAPFNAKLCPTCADIQKHGIIYCHKCGGRYTKYNGLTLMGAIRIASQLPAKYKDVMVDFRPSYVVAVNLRRALKLDSGITKESFIKHIEDRLRG